MHRLRRGLAAALVVGGLLAVPATAAASAGTMSLSAPATVAPGAGDEALFTLTAGYSVDPGTYASAGGAYIFTAIWDQSTPLPGGQCPATAQDAETAGRGLQQYSLDAPSGTRAINESFGSSQKVVFCAWVESSASDTAPLAGPASAVVQILGPWQPNTSACGALMRSEIAKALHKRRVSASGQGSICTWYFRSGNAALTVSAFNTPAEAAATFQGYNCYPHQHRLTGVGTDSKYCHKGFGARLYVLEGRLWIYWALNDPKLKGAAQQRASKRLCNEALARLGH